MANPYEPPATTSRDSSEGQPRKPNPWRWFRLAGVLGITLMLVCYDLYDFRGDRLVLDQTRLIPAPFCLIGMAAVIIWPRWYTVVIAAAALVCWFVFGPGQSFLF